MGRRFFITGGTGLIGRALLRELLPNLPSLDISSITLLSRDPDRFAQAAPDIARHAAVRLVAGDVATVAPPESGYTDVIHGATDSGDLGVADRYAYFWSIVSGTKRMLDLASQWQTERFLYLSSGAVYGPGEYPVTGIPESWAIAPALADGDSAYGQAKRASEHLCALWAARSGRSAKVARIFSVVGDEMPLSGQYAMGNFIRDAISPGQEAITIKGDGTPVRSYLHVDDVARWLIRIHDSPAGYDVFNVGSEVKISIRQLAQVVSANARVPKPVVVSRQAADYAARSVYVPDCRHAAETLKLSQSIDLATAVRRVLRTLEVPL